MATDWAADIRKYAPEASEAEIAGIVRYCGIALRTADASLVAFSDKEELKRVRDGFLKRKLALTETNEELDAAIAEVGVVLKGRRKLRPTVYYLLAQKFGKLAMFDKAAAKPAAAGKAPAAAKPAPAARTPAKAAAAKPAVAAKPAKTPAKPAAAKRTTAKKASIAAETPAEVTGAAVGTVSAAVGGSADDGMATMAAASNLSTAGEAAALEATGAVPSAAEAMAHPVETARADAVAHAIRHPVADDSPQRSWGWIVWVVLAVVVVLAVWCFFGRG